ncbi:MAG: hypothetical protein IPK32_19095 [Verrucomicrobiaceae bacterium]|nr:hypothetical protein [Verrucomicrobiaceae bacterium]
MKPTALILPLALALSAHAADDKKAADPAIEAAMQKVNTTGASLMPTAADGKTYRFTALNVAKEFADSGLDALAPIADKLASLDLSKSKVTDGGLSKVAAMKNLQELHLENTAISDAGLDHLKGLASLEYLNLYNTKVTDAGIAKLAPLSKLKALYLWQSGVTKAGVAALKAKLPNTHINNGWTAEDDAKPAAIVAAAAAPAAVAKPATAPTATAAAKPAAPATTAAAPAAKLDPAIAAKAIVYRDVIAPIMQAKCVGCHGEEKKKGKLQLHTFAAILKGGGDGPNTVIAKNTKDSLMLTRAALPTDDDEHMPPAMSHSSPKMKSPSSGGGSRPVPPNPPLSLPPSPPQKSKAHSLPRSPKASPKSPPQPNPKNPKPSPSPKLRKSKLPKSAPK